MSGHGDEQLRKALWNLYWRGTADVRRRIETELAGDVRPARRPEPPDPQVVHDEVAEFVALAELIDLACVARDKYLFRSEDPVAAAGFVVSDAAAELWAAIWRRHGFQRFAEIAAPQLIRWESGSGWACYGEGPVAAKETTLAVVLTGLLKVPDAWVGFAEEYRKALGNRSGKRTALAEWNRLLDEHLGE